MKRNLLCLLFVAVVGICVYGQSGRRQNKPAPAAPVPTPTPEPSPSPTPKSDAEFGFVIGVDRNSNLASFPYSYYTAVLQGCTDALRKGYSTGVTVSEKDLNRSDAIKEAKAESKSYVVLLTLSDGTMNPMQSPSDSELQLEYVVFAPGTGKIATSGRSYQNVQRKGPVIVGPRTSGPSSTIYREQLLKSAAEEAGDRILKALHLGTSTRTN